MLVNYLLYSLLGIAFLCGLLAFLAHRAGKRSEGNILSEYLLASGSLGRASVLNLLVSSSFGINALFYGAWLGYSLGLYALLIQLAWSGSFLFLSRYADTVRSHKSMHHFLGYGFGPTTRVVAGTLSLLGMTYFIGWEAEIARHSFAGLFTTDLNTTAGLQPMQAGLILTSGTAIICILYTVFGGLKGNAWADAVLNTIKLLCLLGLIYVLLRQWTNSANTSLKTALFPPWVQLLAFGPLAFLTNIAFNLSWQFVDASSWQSIISGRQREAGDARWNVFASGITIFFVPNLLGTLIGILLAGAEGITPDNVIGQAAAQAAQLHPFLLLVAGTMFIACVMSLLDGMFLACSFALVVDILFPKKTIVYLESDPLRAEYLLLGVRLGLLVIAVTGTWGVRWLMSVFGVSVFDFVYVMVITQLSLLGPILLGLLGRQSARLPMWLPILVSAGIGFLLAWFGTHGWSSAWVDGAGAITAGVSLALAAMNSRKVAEERQNPEAVGVSRE